MSPGPGSGILSCESDTVTGLGFRGIWVEKKGGCKHSTNINKARIHFLNYCVRTLEYDVNNASGM